MCAPTAALTRTDQARAKLELLQSRQSSILDCQFSIVAAVYDRCLAFPPHGVRRLRRYQSSRSVSSLLVSNAGPLSSESFSAAAVRDTENGSSPSMAPRPDEPIARSDCSPDIC